MNRTVDGQGYCIAADGTWKRSKGPSAFVMTVGVRYIVTKASANKEFQVGDRVQLLADGRITNHQSAGWMDAEDVPAATRGWAVEIDTAWVEARRAELERQLAALNVAPGAA